MSLNHRQRAIITHALSNPNHLYTIKGHRISNHIAYATARKDLFDLSKQGLLHFNKIGKKYRFTPARDIESKLAALADKENLF